MRQVPIFPEAPLTYLLSTLALLAAPFAYAAAERQQGARDALDGFVVVTLLGIVALHIVPDAWRVAGLAGTGFLLAGLGFPVLLERVYRRALARAHLFVLALAAAGIVIHAVLDGIALLPVGGDEGPFGSALALGVILHRIPVGIAVWWVVRPQFGTGPAVAVFLVILLVTGLSYFFGSGFLQTEPEAIALFQSFVAGSLVHVAFYGVRHDHGMVGAGPEAEGGAREKPGRLQSGPFRVGMILGLAAVWFLPHLGGA